MNWPYSHNEIKLLQLELSSFCNLNCPGCEREFNKDVESLSALATRIEDQIHSHRFTGWEITEDRTVKNHLNTKHMTLAQIKSWFNRNTLPNINEINFSGGIEDSAMNPEVYEICEYLLSEYDCYIIMNTNGSLRTPDFWRKLGGLGIQVEFALDGLEDTLPIYRVGADYNKVIENALAFIEGGGWGMWKFIEFKHNAHQVEEARRQAKELGFKAFTHVKSSRPASYDMNTVTDFTSEETETVQCRALHQFPPWLFVNYDGVMSPCCFFGYNERSTHPEDSLEVSTPAQFFESSKFLKELTDGWDTPNCNRRCFIKCKLNRQDFREITRFF
jgi:MoaA/NifB/PqqE/SkfB family radical SAM enzyme